MKEALRADNKARARLTAALAKALRECIEDVQSELDAAGEQDVRGHPMLSAKAQNLKRYRAVLAKYEAHKRLTDGATARGRIIT
jgi:hypothetical protein